MAEIAAGDVNAFVVYPELGHRLVLSTDQERTLFTLDTSQSAASVHDI